MEHDSEQDGGWAQCCFKDNNISVLKSHNFTGFLHFEAAFCLKQNLKVRSPKDSKDQTAKNSLEGQSHRHLADIFKYNKYWYIIVLI